MSDVLEILKEVGAIMTDDHFVYTSGKHGSVYINKDALYPHTAKVSDIGKIFAEKYKDDSIEIVVGPALGGIILSQWTAHHLSKLTGKQMLSVYTEKDENKSQVFTRGYDKLVKGKKVLIVEDIVNTGGSVKKVIEAVQHVGGTIIAACVMVNRDPIGVTSQTMGATFHALSVLEAGAYEAADCPLCREGVPINTDVGHGKEFIRLRRKPRP